jgi:hypothetical protein
MGEIRGGIQGSTIKLGNFTASSTNKIMAIRATRIIELGCFHILDHTNIPLIFQVNLIGQKFLGVIEQDFSCASLPLIPIVWKSKGSFMPILSL